jgi:hypothetical protein
MCESILETKAEEASRLQTEALLCSSTIKAAAIPLIGSAILIFVETRLNRALVVVAEVLKDCAAAAGPRVCSRLSGFMNTTLSAQVVVTCKPIRMMIYGPYCRNATYTQTAETSVVRNQHAASGWRFT